jgi:hypothetical protein
VLGRLVAAQPSGAAPEHDWLVLGEQSSQVSFFEQPSVVGVARIGHRRKSRLGHGRIVRG